MPDDQFQVPDLLPLAARTIRDRLQELDEIEEADWQVKVINEAVARERLELLRLAIDVYCAYLGVFVKRH